MKKFQMLFIVLVLSFGLMACDGDDGERGGVGPSGYDDFKKDAHIPDGFHTDLKSDGTITLCKDGYHWQEHTEDHVEADDGHTDTGDHADCYNDAGEIYVAPTP